MRDVQPRGRRLQALWRDIVKTITIILWALTLAAATMHLAVYAADNKNAAMVALAEANTCDCSQSIYVGTIGEFPNRGSDE